VVPCVGGDLVGVGGVQVSGDAGQQVCFALVVGDLVGQGGGWAELAGLVEQCADLAGGDPAGLIGHHGGVPS
jgi:hypothetical protein